jgi:hypothetical protein
MLPGSERETIRTIAGRDRTLSRARHPDVNARERLSVGAIRDLADQRRSCLRECCSRRKYETDDKEDEREEEVTSG